VPFAIFQLRGAFETIPVDLEEAAMVDGATRFAGLH
jgi:arabinogalactan oligomer/maltooligosaccharide transport system permease protein